jgi:short subunit dehydrogenase-like uncharacterized protein
VYAAKKTCKKRNEKCITVRSQIKKRQKEVSGEVAQGGRERRRTEGERREDRKGRQNPKNGHKKTPKKKRKKKPERKPLRVIFNTQRGP